MNFANKLHNLRTKRKMSQEDLAEVLGVSRQAVQKWEAGLSSPEKNNLVALSDYFEVSLDVLLKDELTLDSSFKKEKEPPTSSSPHYPKLSYEYKSKRIWRGLPLVHINFGYGFQMATAKGIIAIGDLAVGLISIGGVALGLFSIGGISLGLILALAGISFGGIAAGGICAGIAAFGGIAYGILAVGGIAIGTYAVGGMALGSKIAIGHIAKGYLAIGEELKGIVEITNEQLRDLTPTQIKTIILEEYPKLWKPFVDFLVKVVN